MARQEGAQAGLVVTFPVAPYAVPVGGGVLVGAFFGVATGGPPSSFPVVAGVVQPCTVGAPIECDVFGVRPIVKTTGVAWTFGQPIYWDNTNKKGITVATANKFIGYATEPAASGDVIGYVWLANSKDVVG